MAGKKNIPLPIMALIVINNMVVGPKLFSNFSANVELPQTSFSLRFVEDYLKVSEKKNINFNLFI